MSVRISDRTVTRLITDLSADFYVRKQLNQDYAIHLGQLVESDIDLGAIYITRDNKIIDGRTRYEGHQLAQKTEIKCKIVEADSEVELIVFAAECNMGGSMPQTQGDMEHTLQELLNRNVPKKQLVDMFKMLPAKIVRSYLANLESRNARLKLQRAASAVTNGGLSASKSAEQYEVSEPELRALLGAKVNRKTQNGVDEVKRLLSTSYKSLGQRNSAAVRRLLEAYQDGDVSHKQVAAIFKHLDHLIKNSSRTAADWKKRFESMEAPKKS